MQHAQKIATCCYCGSRTVLNLAGRTRHVRRFGKPRTLDPGETAWVVGDVGPVVVFLNSEEVGRAGAGPFAFEVTARLQARNELAVEGELGEVALEIRGSG